MDDTTVDKLRNVLTNQPLYRLPEIVVFFQCTGLTTSATFRKDVEGYYHTPYFFSSVDEAALCLDELTSICYSAFLLTKGNSPATNISNIYNYLKLLPDNAMTVDGVSFTERDLLEIGFLANCTTLGRKQILGTLVILNSKGYAGNGLDYKKSAQNILMVM